MRRGGIFSCIVALSEQDLKLPLVCGVLQSDAPQLGDKVARIGAGAPRSPLAGPRSGRGCRAPGSDNATRFQIDKPDRAGLQHIATSAALHRGLSSC
jgi:hypothetical protein